MAVILHTRSIREILNNVQDQVFINSFFFKIIWPISSQHIFSVTTENTELYSNVHIFSAADNAKITSQINYSLTDRILIIHCIIWLNLTYTNWKHLINLCYFLITNTHIIYSMLYAKEATNLHIWHLPHWQTITCQTPSRCSISYTCIKTNAMTSHGR